MSETLIKVEGVSKKFCRSLKKSLWYGLQDLGREMTGQRHGGNGELRPDEFWAVKDVSFELKRGECLGLIGRNGAGKTTLLRMLNGLIKPDTGRIEMLGRVGALIALGAGFNPILTGRENIYVNAAVLGLSKKDTDAKFEEIVDFAELGEFIDTPVQSYSSGMGVRLGFAAAVILLKPDVLLLDEVLAVGDINFQIKCGRRIRELASRATVIFVSHNMHYVSWFCSRVMVLKAGCVLCDALDPAEGIQTFLSLIEIKEDIFTTGEISVGTFYLVTSSGNILPENAILNHCENISVHFDLHINSSQITSHLILCILDASANGVIYFPVNNSDGSEPIFTQGIYNLSISLGALDLNGGKYSIMVALFDVYSKALLLRRQGICPFQISGATYTSAKIIRPAVSTMLTKQSATQMGV